MGEHYYTVLGEPKYDVGLRNARKNSYLPSITCVDKMIANPGLEIWKQNIILETATYYPRDRDSETAEEYMSDIKRIAFGESRKAMKLGNVIHKLAERYIMGKPLFFRGQRSDVWRVFEPLRGWIDVNLLPPRTGIIYNEGAEVVLVNEKLGYAGKADFVGRFNTPGKPKIILDFKTTTVKKSDVKKTGGIKKFKLYDSYCRQLTALDSCNNDRNILISVIVSTDPNNSGVWTHIWNDKEITEAWKQFIGALMIYKSLKNL